MIIYTKIGCVLASKRNRSTEELENNHTGVMDEADGSELNNTPAKLDGNASIEGKEKEQHPPRGVTSCMPCNIHVCDSMS